MSNEWAGGGLDAVEILEALGVHRRSGAFQITCDGEAYGLYVQYGKIIYATSSQRTLRLGHFLLQRGAVEPVYLHDVLRGRRTIARDRPLGSVLIRDGAVTYQALAAGVEEQAIEVISRLIGLNRATFVYYPDQPIPDGIEIVPLETDRLLSKAEERHVDRVATKVMQRLLPPPDTPLTLTVNLTLVSFLLTDAELMVALQLDRAAMSLNRLAETLALEPLTLNRTVISLIERGFIASGDPELRFDY